MLRICARPHLAVSWERRRLQAQPVQMCDVISMPRTSAHFQGSGWVLSPWDTDEAPQHYLELVVGDWIVCFFPTHAKRVRRDCCHHAKARNRHYGFSAYQTKHLQRVPQHRQQRRAGGNVHQRLELVENGNRRNNIENGRRREDILRSRRINRCRCTGICRNTMHRRQYQRTNHCVGFGSGTPRTGSYEQEFNTTKIWLPRNRTGPAAGQPTPVRNAIIWPKPSSASQCPKGTAGLNITRRCSARI